jgi:3'-phosphoadenosine 5'-phosphosulfate sulfotransferase (PAPS reductase)/FAD synthetase
MYDQIKKEIYEKLLENKDKSTALFWSGGPYSSLVWFVAYVDLNLRFPIIFVDTGDLPPTLYAHIAKIRNLYKLDLTIISGSLKDIIEAHKNRYEILYSGKPLEGTTTIIPEGPETWNYIKSLNMPFFGPARKLVLS